MQRFVSLDVSELEPPEPMEEIFEQLRDLQSGAALKVFHRREPLPIYPMLDKMGYSHCSQRLQRNKFVIYIWPTVDKQLGEFCRHAANIDTQP
ncbi:MAG: DUF2249 domain-containing protein [Motiliproteus sp.]|nr:DUF2249 domain-containing protein [Motiliproteus sp.]MCW9053441.1 DUF2249 domain-containing protein [Motiliproteus sp.]